jgi:hypothetical protein
MVLLLGVVALVAVVVGVGLVLVAGARQASDAQGPVSRPSDYVAPPSGDAPGSYRWRRDDETPEQFHDRIARENAAARPHQAGGA